jgi:hypothetical protein
MFPKYNLCFLCEGHEDGRPMYLKLLKLQDKRRISRPWHQCCFSVCYCMIARVVRSEGMQLTSME